MQRIKSARYAIAAIPLNAKTGPQHFTIGSAGAHLRLIAHHENERTIKAPSNFGNIISVNDVAAVNADKIVGKLGF